jgi:hypothetical protein
LLACVLCVFFAISASLANDARDPASGRTEKAKKVIKLYRRIVVVKEAAWSGTKAE